MTATYVWIALALLVGFLADRAVMLPKLARVERERDEAYARGYQQATADARAINSYGARASGVRDGADHAA